jgi:hypothetical protein
MDDVAQRLEQWSRTVADTEHGYPLTYDDFLNDLDVRHQLGALAKDGEQLDALAALDARFREATYQAGDCVWGGENAAAEAWDRDQHWYYWRLPRHPGPAFGE